MIEGEVYYWVKGGDGKDAIAITKAQTQMLKNSGLYETDFYAWTIAQAKFLQDGVWDCLDICNLVEEIESLGKQQRQELRNRLGILLGHLLKWELPTIGYCDWCKLSDLTNCTLL